MRCRCFSATICNVRQEDIPQENTAGREENLILGMRHPFIHHLKGNEFEIDNLQQRPDTVVRLDMSCNRNNIHATRATGTVSPSEYRLRAGSWDSMHQHNGPEQPPKQTDRRT